MTEVDYQLALLLQNKFEQEKRDSNLAKTLQEQFQNEGKTSRNRSSGTELSDSIIARSLQEQFQTELEVERPSQNLVYDVPTNRNSKYSKSLTDPSWEVIDPTPDIHNLFMAFNERFFWNRLGSVCVLWSNRMTTCAGICSYQGRGGMCTITLSEPLLKLRPRKDLVETLLHEMIHAYLFVTHNNRDRDGHGPEFHKHMKRINDEAGTNITVYHDFHDEVNLYKQHWWRCNGPCQTRKPYFGLLRRAMNRAPGPNDSWWAEHSRTCGGTFIKVKEPEKQTKSKKLKSSTAKSKTSTNTPKSPDIRKFFPSNKSKQTSGSKIQTITSINDNNQSKSNISKVFSNSNNIVGFTNCDTNGIENKENKSSKPSVEISNTNSTGGNRLGSNNSVSDGDYSVVRNHWANKFSNTNSMPQNKPLKKRFSFDIPSTSTEKVPKLSSNQFTECPVCSRKISVDEINGHLDVCLKTDELKECYICGTNILKQNLQTHIDNCIKESFDDDVFVSPTRGSNKDVSVEIISDSESNDITKIDINKKRKCDVCKAMVAEEIFDVHLNDCLHKMFDKIEEQIGDSKNTSVLKNHNSEIKVECLACNKKILKSELTLHLEDCMSLSNIFENENEPVEGEIEENKLYNCPSCMKLFNEIEMKDHIDICLDVIQIVDDS